MLAITQKIVDNLAGKSTVAFKLDKETIDQIGNIVLQIVALFQSCKKTPEEATQVAHNPSVVEKRQLKKVVRKELGFFKNLRDGQEYYDAVLKAAYTASVEEVKEAYRSA